MELTGIIVGLLIAAGALAAGAGAIAHRWAAGHGDFLQAAGARLSRSRPGPIQPGPIQPGPAQPGPAQPGDAGHDRPPAAAARERNQGMVALLLLTGLAVIMLAAIALGKLVDDVTEGHGVAVIDHPIARFVAAHREPALTSFMRGVSAVGGPAGLVVLALVAGVLLGVAWRSWAPGVMLAVTAAGVVGLTVAFKAALSLARPPQAQAVAAADGYGFPSGHAAAAAAVCAAIAWLLTLRLPSWRHRTAVWVVAAMLAALVGLSRVYLGVHWVTDVLGGWAFGLLWAAVVVTGWAAAGHLSGLRR
jgi:membrane-associated phospholipid phosphatase